jgi:hypothetical protein
LAAGPCYIVLAWTLQKTSLPTAPPFLQRHNVRFVATAVSAGFTILALIKYTIILLHFITPYRVWFP